MKLKKIFAGMSAMAIMAATVASVSAADANAPKDSTPASKLPKVYTADASTKSSAWAGDFDQHPVVVDLSKESFDITKVDTVNMYFAYKGSNINGQVGTNVGKKGTKGMWMQSDFSYEDDDGDVTKEGNITKKGSNYKFSWDGVISKYKQYGGLQPGATMMFKINGFNHTGKKKNWEKTTTTVTCVEFLNSKGQCVKRYGKVPSGYKAAAMAPSNSGKKNNSSSGSSNSGNSGNSNSGNGGSDQSAGGNGNTNGEDNSNAGTGATTGLALAGIALAGAAIVATKKKK